MGNKEWPDDWKVGNGSARVGLWLVLAPAAAVLIGTVLRAVWPIIASWLQS